MKNKKTIIIIVAISLLLGAIILFSFSNTNQQSANTQSQEPTEESGELTPEEVLKNLDTADSEEISNAEFSLEIIGPEGEDFTMSQARYYQAALSTSPEMQGVRFDCNWNFYLNQYSEETLYRTQEGAGIIGEDGNGTCGFTSTFIDSRGELRVSLDVDVLSKDKEVLKELSAERNYTVN